MSESTFSPFPVFTNIFYFGPLVISFILGWNFLAFFYVGVTTTSFFYHLCENTQICVFGWPLITWRILDHIAAWYSLAITFLIVFNSDKYSHRTYNGKLHHIYVDKFSPDYIFLDFIHVTLFFEIIYFSTSMINAYPVPQIVISSTLVFGVLVSRVLSVLFIHTSKRYKDGEKETIKLKKHKKCKGLCPKFHLTFFVISILFLIIAIVLFIVYDDADGVAHGLWHAFGALSGLLLLLSVFYKQRGRERE